MSTKVPRQAVIEACKQYRTFLELMVEISLREITKENSLKPKKGPGRSKKQQTEDTQQKQITNFFNLNSLSREEVINMNN